MPATPLHDFVWQHRDDDPRQLALSAKKFPNIPMAAAAAQVQALQKIRTKIPAWYQPGMAFPRALSLEQASSETTARFKAGLFSGERMADLTGGLGVDAFFFAQRFAELVYVEQLPELLAAAQQNFGQLGVSNVAFQPGTAEDFLANNPSRFDLIYLDPARRDERKGKVFQLADCSPNVLAIKELLLEKSPRVLLKTAPLLDLKLAAEQLGRVSKIWVVASEGDCREVLYLLERDAPALADIPIEAWNLSAAEASSFAFRWTEEKQAAVEYAVPKQFLYEPNPAILKAGAFRSFAGRFGLAKLHANTHLYTSETLVADVPGRRFCIEQVCKYDRKAVQPFVAQGKANIACRNFPDTPDAVRLKLGLADGGDTYLFAVTDAENRKVVLVCRKAEQ